MVTTDETWPKYKLSFTYNRLLKMWPPDYTSYINIKLADPPDRPWRSDLAGNPVRPKVRRGNGKDQ